MNNYQYQNQYQSPAPAPKKKGGCFKNLLLFIIAAVLLFAVLDTVIPDDSLSDGNGYSSSEASSNPFDYKPSDPTSSDSTSSEDTAETPIVNKPSYIIKPAATNAVYTYYNQLSKHEKAAYDAMYDAVARGQESFTITVDASLNDNSINKVMMALIWDHGELYWLSSNGGTWRQISNYGGERKFSITIYHYDYFKYKTDLSKYTERVEQKLDKLVADASKLSSDYDKAKFVYDYIINTTDYATDLLEESEKANHSPESELIRSIYNAYTNGDIVCVGYARAYQVAMQRLGIECTMVTGDAGGGHAWNLVKLDGKYYLSDPTWDDPVGKQEDTITYDYFNLNDKEMSVEHTADMAPLSVPKCQDTLYNYYHRNSYILNAYSFDAVVSVLNAQKSQDILTVKFASKAEFEKAKKELITNNKAADIDFIFSSDGKYYYQANPDYLYIRFYK